MTSIHGVHSSHQALSPRIMQFQKGAGSGRTGSIAPGNTMPNAAAVAPFAKQAASQAAPTKSSSPPPPPTNPGTLGDVDGDGQMTSEDARMLMSYLFQGGPTPINMSNADVNGDGSINLADATQISNLVNAQPSVTTPIAGDVDGDGTVSKEDAKALLQQLFNGGGKSAQDIAGADVNGDGAVNISDVIGILNLTNNPMLLTPNQK